MLSRANGSLAGRNKINSQTHIQTNEKRDIYLCQVCSNTKPVALSTISYQILRRRFDGVTSVDSEDDKDIGELGVGEDAKRRPPPCVCSVVTNGTGAVEDDADDDADEEKDDDEAEECGEAENIEAS